MLVSRISVGGEYHREGAGLEKSMFAVLLKLLAWDRQPAYITCRVQSVRDSVRTEKVRDKEKEC